MVQARDDGGLQGGRVRGGWIWVYLPDRMDRSANDLNAVGEKKGINDDSKDYGKPDLPLTETAKTAGRTGSEKWRYGKFIMSGNHSVDILCRQIIT